MSTNIDGANLDPIENNVPNKSGFYPCLFGTFRNEDLIISISVGWVEPRKRKAQATLTRWRSLCLSRSVSFGENPTQPNLRKLLNPHFLVGYCGVINFKLANELPLVPSIAETDSQ